MPLFMDVHNVPGGVPAADVAQAHAADVAVQDKYGVTYHRYWEWCEQYLPHLPEQVHDWVTSEEFDRLLRDTVAATYPAHEQEEFLAHFRGLLGMWVDDQSAGATIS